MTNSDLDISALLKTEFTECTEFCCLEETYYRESHVCVENRNYPLTPRICKGPKHNRYL